MVAMAATLGYVHPAAAADTVLCRLGVDVSSREGIATSSGYGSGNAGRN